MFTLRAEQPMTDQDRQPIPAPYRSNPQGIVSSGATMQHAFCFRASNLMKRTEGSQLLELALILPIMLVMMISVADFGQAWNIKQKLTNAAREGTRIAASAPSFEATNCAVPLASSPCSVQAAADTVKKYMVNAGLNASCITPNTPSTSDSSTATYTYTCNGLTMSIVRPYLFTATGGAQVIGTQVSLTYPYTWSLNQAIGLLHQSGSISLPSTISTNSVMPNLN